MKFLHPKVIHHLTTAYYSSLYLTSVFIQLYITGLFVVSYSMPYGGSHCRSGPPYIQGWFFPNSVLFQVRVELGCKQWNFCYGCFYFTYAWAAAFTLSQAFVPYISLVLVSDWFSCWNHFSFGQSAEKMVTKVCEGHATFRTNKMSHPKPNIRSKQQTGDLTGNER